MATSRAARKTKLALAAMAAIGVVGALGHTRWGRNALAVMGVGGCPMLSTSPKERDMHRAATLATLRGTERAPSRIALGTDVGRASADDVTAWAKRDVATCEKDERIGVIRCRAEALGGEPADVVFVVDAKGVVQGIDVMRDKTTVALGAERLTKLTAELKATLGPPTSSSGEPTAAFLGAAFGRTEVQYRFSDYAVDVSATHFGDGSLVVREQYRAVPDAIAVQ